MTLTSQGPRGQELSPTAPLSSRSGILPVSMSSMEPSPLEVPCGEVHQSGRAHGLGRHSLALQSGYADGQSWKALGGCQTPITRWTLGSTQGSDRLARRGGVRSDKPPGAPRGSSDPGDSIEPLSLGFLTCQRVGSTPWGGWRGFFLALHIAPQMVYSSKTKVPTPPGTAHPAF